MIGLLIAIPLMGLLAFFHSSNSVLTLEDPGLNAYQQPSNPVNPAYENAPRYQMNKY